jgi:Domain of Unknown Function with PDB structure (DUF3857)
MNLISRICTAALFVLIIAAPARAQEWLTLQPNPALHQVNAAFSGEGAVIILDKRLHDYVPANESLSIIVSQHRIIRVQTEEGVEMYNKMYIPVPYDGQIEDIKARVITPSGKVIDLPKEKILDVEEEGRPFKKFALEGVEIGSEIEILTRVTKGLGFFGLEVFQSERTPCQRAEFTLKVPEHLVFDAKGYNGIKLGSDSVMEKKRVITGGGENIPVLEGEKYGEPGPYMAHVQYKLSYNKTGNEKVRIFTWNQLAQNVYERNAVFNEKETKAVAGFLKNAKLQGNTTDERISGLENYIKGTINFNEEPFGEEGQKLENIIKNKVADFSGVIRLFSASFQQMGIPFQFVYPNRRDDIPKDEKLENYRLIEQPVFYFPDTKQFMDATNLGYRYPYLEPYNAGTRGLFVKTTVLGGTTSVYASFDTIPMPDWQNTKHNLEAAVKLNENLDSVILYSKHIFTGYAAAVYRSVINFVPAAQLKEVTEEILKSASSDARVADNKLSNTSFSDGLANKELLVEGNLVSADLVEQAGKRILLKIGNVIGPQVEMYQEKERRLPFTIEYPHVLDRKVELVIPEGYYVKNPDDILIKFTGEESGKDDMGFISTYTLEGNKLVITIHEYYKEINYAKSRVENYRRVINAAADFNKVVLVIEKK